RRARCPKPKRSSSSRWPRRTRPRPQIPPREVRAGPLAPRWPTAPRRRWTRLRPQGRRSRSRAKQHQRPPRAPAGPPPTPRRRAATADPAPAAAPVNEPPVPDPPATADPPPAPPEPRFVEVVVPASAVIGLQVERSLSTETARVEDRVEARVTRDVMADGHRAIPAGSRMLGSVTLVERGGKVKDAARLGVRFH